MSGWLIAGWLVLLFIAFSFWGNISWSRLQRRVAAQRANLDRAAYVEDLSRSAVGPKVAEALHDALKPFCVEGVLPNPDDGLCGFYFDDPEDMEDLVEEMFEKLELPMPTRYEPEITPHMESARNLAIHLQQRLSS